MTILPLYTLPSTVILGTTKFEPSLVIVVLPTLIVGLVTLSLITCDVMILDDTSKLDIVIAVPSDPINAPPKSIVCAETYNVFQRLLALPKLNVLSALGTKFELMLFVILSVLVVIVPVKVPLLVEILGAKSSLKGVL